MFKNEIFARGSIVGMNLHEITSNMRMRVRDTARDKYEMIDDTVEVKTLRGVITLRVNGEDMKFRVEVTKQKQYFTGGERIKEFYGYEKWLEFQEHFKEDSDPENNRVELQGYLKDGSFFDKDGNRMVNCMSWVADRIRWAGDYPDAAMGKFCGMFMRDGNATRLFAAPSVGKTPFRLYSKILDCVEIPEEVKKAVKKTGFSPAVNVVIQRIQDVQMDEMCRPISNNGIKITRVEVTEQEGEYGFITADAVRTSVAGRAAYELKLKREAQYDML